MSIVQWIWLILMRGSQTKCREKWKMKGGGALPCHLSWGPQLFVIGLLTNGLKKKSENCLLIYSNFLSPNIRYHLRNCVCLVMMSNFNTIVSWRLLSYQPASRFENRQKVSRWCQSLPRRKTNDNHPRHAVGQLVGLGQKVAGSCSCQTQNNIDPRISVKHRCWYS